MNTGEAAEKIRNDTHPTTTARWVCLFVDLQRTLSGPQGNFRKHCNLQHNWDRHTQICIQSMQTVALSNQSELYHSTQAEDLEWLEAAGWHGGRITGTFWIKARKELRLRRKGGFCTWVGSVGRSKGQETGESKTPEQRVANKEVAGLQLGIRLRE